jgi:hypothetical protein
MLAHLVLLFLACSGVRAAEVDTTGVKGYFMGLVGNLGYVYGNYTAEWAADGKVYVRLNDVRKLFKDGLKFSLTYKKAADATGATVADVVEKCQKVIDTGGFKCVADLSAVTDKTGKIAIFYEDSDPVYHILELDYTDKKFKVDECKNALIPSTQSSQCTCLWTSAQISQCKDSFPTSCSMTEKEDPTESLKYPVRAIRFENGDPANFNPISREIRYVFDDRSNEKYYTLSYNTIGGQEVAGKKQFYMRIEIGKTNDNMPSALTNGAKRLTTNFKPAPVTVFENAYCTREDKAIRCMCCDQKPGSEPPMECLKEVPTTTKKTTKAVTTKKTPAPPMTKATTVDPNSDTKDGAAKQIIHIFPLVCLASLLYVL